ncbi:C1QTNF4 [Branchiostoma lanceolatum]|uniref:C1QTNF4 protein n=1 Tax=Branchiostoma lanceolatum TaxID=7740 RepID=A0A8J9Z010_BRALA|nr:C1QTNF4 [Branchiostoma lanceolatum]
MAVWTIAVLLITLQVTPGNVGCPMPTTDPTPQTSSRVSCLHPDPFHRSGPGSSTADLTVTFDHVLTDVGGSFPDVTNLSVFNCQHPGVYLFSFSSLAKLELSATVKLMKNGELQLAMWAPGIPGNSGSGSNTAVLELEQGDRVWLVIGTPNRRAIHSNTNRYVSFTGVLLYST